MRKFYPLRDPISDLHRVLVEHSHVDLHVYINGSFAGVLRTGLGDQIQFINLLTGRQPVAEANDDLSEVDFFFDYDKRVVVEDNGGIVETKELQ